MDYLAEILKAEDAARLEEARKASREALKARKAGKRERIAKMMGNLSKVAVVGR